jgi:DNA (cytosine-5)-methyltransferase 1
MNRSPRPRVIDLFSGCGGLSKGFELAGFEIAGFVESWKIAVDTFKANFPESKHLGNDITKISDEEIKEIEEKYGEIDGIIGGPPCQGFSSQGKRDPKDPRNSLLMEFIRFVKILRPKFIVMENVKGLLSSKTATGAPVIDIILNEFRKTGYNVDYKVLMAADYGVPQLRERVIFIGNNLGRKNMFPEPNHFKTPHLDLATNRMQKKWVTVGEAIGNLPPIEAGGGWEEIECFLETTNNWQRWIQGEISWEEYLEMDQYLPQRLTSKVILRDHITKPQREIDLERGKYIPEGRHIRSITPCGLKNDIFPDKRLHLKFGESMKQKYWRLHRNRLSETVLTDWFSMRFKIHYEQLRPPSVREVARLQSFPDSFVFRGTIIQKYRQIGNAVPVLMAYSIGKTIKEKMFPEWNETDHVPKSKILVQRSVSS